MDSPSPALANLEDKQIRIKIIGVGGAGNNAVDRLKLDNLGQVGLAVVNTDSKTLSVSPIQEKLMIGRSLTRGLSAGGEADLGLKAAEADRPLIDKLVDGVDLVFLLAGLGGGTGSGATPLIAEAAAEADAVVVAFVTMPFTREGQRRHKQAEDSLTALRKHCHAVITLPNDMLMQQVPQDATVMEAFSLADEWMSRGVRSIWALLFQQGLINVDFATLRNAFRFQGGRTLFGLGEGSGPDCVQAALNDLDNCPLLLLPEYKYARKADSLIVNITGGPGLSLAHVNQIMDSVCEKFGSRDNTVLGAVIDDDLHDGIRITVIGSTDLGGARVPRSQRKAPSTVPSATPVLEGTPDTEPDITRLPAKQPGGKGRNAGQEEFSFHDPAAHRGFFDKTEENVHEGEDLDVPTFLRRGIKVALN